MEVEGKEQDLMTTSMKLGNDYSKNDGIIEVINLKKKLNEIKDRCLKKPAVLQNALLDTDANTITDTEQYASYYYVDRPLYHTLAGSAVKISLTSELHKPITKTFHYDESKFTKDIFTNVTVDTEISHNYETVQDENSISLYRYSNQEIEDLCFTSIEDEQKFTVDSSGGTFTLGDVEISIPEDAVLSESELTISNVKVEECIKEIDTNLDREISTVEVLVYIWDKIVTGYSTTYELYDYIERWLEG
jgi:hypothetical protein